MEQSNKYTYKYLKCDMSHFKVNFIFSKFQKIIKKTIDMTASYVIVRGVIKNIKNIKNKGVT